MAGRRSSIISGCSRCARTCAGAMRSTSRSCRHCGGPMCQCGGPISPSGTPAIPTRRCESGSSSAIARSSKAELAERPADPFVLFNLGAVAVERQDWRTALGYLQRSLRGSGPKDSIVRKLFALIARCHQMLGDLPAALGACAEGLQLDPDDAELHFRKAVPQSRPAGRGRSLLAADLDAEASRPFLQRRSGHLRPSDPAQPRRAGPSARRPR